MFVSTSFSGFSQVREIPIEVPQVQEISRTIPRIFVKEVPVSSLSVVL